MSENYIGKDPTTEILQTGGVKPPGDVPCWTDRKAQIADACKKGFGRLPVTDLRDHLFPMTRTIAQAQVASPVGWKTKGYKYWDVTEPGLPTDQGPTPRCGEFSARNLLGASPIRNRIATLPKEGQIYALAQSIDMKDYGWGPHDGVATRSVAKAGVELGFWDEYRWDFTFSSAAQEWLLNVGPFLAGTIWPDAMMTPFQYDRQWWIDFDLTKDPTMFGPHAAGHLWCVFGVKTSGVCPDGSTGAIRMIQSWGPTWGDDKPLGTVYLPISKFKILMSEGGEILMPLEKKYVPAK